VAPTLGDRPRRTPLPQHRSCACIGARYWGTKAAIAKQSPLVWDKPPARRLDRPVRKVAFGTRSVRRYESDELR
jgi:hypothetical protein